MVYLPVTVTWGHSSPEEGFLLFRHSTRLWRLLAA